MMLDIPLLCDPPAVILFPQPPDRQRQGRARDFDVNFRLKSAEIVDQ